MRKEAVSGQFYPSGKAELKEKVEKLLANAKTAEKAKIYGIVSPHAGYEYSGEAAAYAYKEIEHEKYDVFILLGPNHTGYGKKVSVTDEDFETPLGIARNDKEFCRELISKFGKSDEAHKYEHGLEVQLPFILHNFKKIKIVPIILSLDSYSECTDLAKELERIIVKLKRKACIIASSDFTHYGSAYGFLPFAGSSEEIKKKLHEMDRKAISFVEKLNGKEFFQYSQKTTICGAAAITTAIELCKKLGAKKAKLLRYYTSGDIKKSRSDFRMLRNESISDISGDYSNAVGYAAIAFV